MGLLVLAEAGLRLADVGPANRLFVPEGVDGEAHYRVNREAAHRFFPPHLLRLVSEDLTFPARKPAGTVRIFALGASTLIGFPNPLGYGFPRFLELVLTDLYPGRRFEVLNCGITALSSVCLLDFAEEVIDYDADLLLLYSGHNEFYGPYGPTTPFVHVGSHRRLIRLHMALQRTRLHWLLKTLVSRASRWANPDADAGFGLHLVTDEIGPADPAYGAVVANYRANLERIADLAEAPGVPLVVGTLVSNVRDFHPLRSDCESDPDATIRLREMADLAAQGRDGEAVALGESLVREHPTCAAAHFELGRVLYRAGRFATARVALTSARDLDQMPFRAPSALNRQIRALGRRPGVVVSDLDSAFAAADAGGVPGDGLVTEFLHPTVAGHFLIARTIADDLAANGVADGWGRRSPDAVMQYDDYRERMGYAPMQAVVGRSNLILLLCNMPYREPPVLLGQRLAGLVGEQLDDVVELSPWERDLFCRRGGLRFLAGVLPLVADPERDRLTARLRGLTESR